uniref:ISXO2-like transposase domain-containing protein n=1 Tax=Ditylenchus dipsaci TaxID=166011 RepID=A0A915E6I9_9BILA
MWLADMELTKICDESFMVEIDESKFGKKEVPSWTSCGGTSVEKRDHATLFPLIQRWIKRESIVIADCWRAYDNLEEINYQLTTVIFVSKAGQKVMARIKQTAKKSIDPQYSKGRSVQLPEEPGLSKRSESCKRQLYFGPENFLLSCCTPHYCYHQEGLRFQSTALMCLHEASETYWLGCSRTPILLRFMPSV